MYYSLEYDSEVYHCLEGTTVRSTVLNKIFQSYYDPEVDRDYDPALHLGAYSETNSVSSTFSKEANDSIMELLDKVSSISSSSSMSGSKKK